MTGFITWITGVGSDWCTNCAITTLADNNIYVTFGKRRLLQMFNTEAAPGNGNDGRYLVPLRMSQFRARAWSSLVAGDEGCIGVYAIL